MRTASVRLNWLKSVSTDVVKQNLFVNVNGEAVVSTDLAADVETHVFGRVRENDEVEVSLVAIDGAGNMSVPATLNFTAIFPDLTAPESPTFVGTGWHLEDIQEEEVL